MVGEWWRVLRPKGGREERVVDGEELIDFWMGYRGRGSRDHAGLRREGRAGDPVHPKIRLQAI